jgi:hypothetical protein
LKTCTKCKVEQEDTAFTKNSYRCRKCTSISQSKYQKSEKGKATLKRYRQKPEVAERLNACSKEYRVVHAEHCKEYNRRPEVMKRNRERNKTVRHAQKEAAAINAMIIGLVCPE